MEGASNSKDSANSTDSDIGQNSPCATDRKKWCQQEEEDNTRSSGGKKPNSKETRTQKKPQGGSTQGSTTHRTDTESYKRTVCMQQK
jgi:hypothetical protein